MTFGDVGLALWLVGGITLAAAPSWPVLAIGAAQMFVGIGIVARCYRRSPNR